MRIRVKKLMIVRFSKLKITQIIEDFFIKETFAENHFIELFH
jgi:hypothetical protein